MAIDRNRDAIALRDHGHPVPILRLEPRLHGFLTWPANPAATIRLVKSARIFLRVNLRLKSSDAAEPFFFDAEIKSAVAFHGLVFETHDEVGDVLVRNKMTKLLVSLRVPGVDDAVLYLPIAFADDVRLLEVHSVPTGFPRMFAEVFEPDVAEAHLILRLVRRMYLQPDETLERLRIHEVCGGNIIHPRLDGSPATLDAILVPLADLERETGGRIRAERKEPPAPRLVVDAAAPASPRLMIHLHLIAMNTVRRNLDGFAPEVIRGFRLKTLAADLHAGVQSLVRLDLEFEDEIAVFLFRAEKRVAAALHGASAHNDAVLHRISRLAAAFDPTVKILAVEDHVEIARGDECMRFNIHIRLRQHNAGGAE